MRRGLFLLVVVVVGVIWVSATHPTVATADPSTAQGMQISPVLINLNADPGKTYTLKLSILNVTTGDLVFTPAVNDFKAKDETGTPEVLLNSTLPPSASIVSWVQPIGTIPLKAKQSDELDVVVNVPINAESGGHYGVIRFSGTAPEQQQNGVSLAASAGVLLLVRVSGPITEQLSLKDFFTERSTSRTSRFQSGPVTFVERISNTGNVHVAPTGNLIVKNMFGKNVASLAVNQTTGNILPSSIRRFEETLKGKSLFGKYTASLSLAYGTQGKVLTGALTFWVIPYKLVIGGLLLLVILILLIWWLIRRYNRWIISKAGPRQPPPSYRPPPSFTSR